MQGWVAECKVVGHCVSTDRPVEGWVAECKVVGHCVNSQANAGLGC